MSVHRKEDFTWQQLEAAFRKLMDFTNGPEESWKEQYGEEFPREEPKEIKPDKKQSKVQKAKKPEKKKPERIKPTGKAENSVDNHTEGQKQQFQKKRTLHQEILKWSPILKHRNLSRKI